MINFSLVMFVAGMMKVLFNSSHLLTFLICLELITLSLISLTWNTIWVQTVWFMTVNVIHSVIGMLMLIVVMRQLGNDKSLNII